MRYVNEKLEFVVPKGIINYNNASDETLASRGYYRVVMPPFDENTQKLENLHIEGNIATYDVVDLSQQEIEQKEQEKQLEQIADFRQRAKADGQECYNNYDVELTAQLFGKPAEIVNPVVAEIDEKLMTILNLVKDGQWYSAMTRIVSLQPLTTSIAENLRLTLRGKILQYVNENYR